MKKLILITSLIIFNLLNLTYAQQPYQEGKFTRPWCLYTYESHDWRPWRHPDGVYLGQNACGHLNGNDLTIPIRYIGTIRPNTRFHIVKRVGFWGLNESYITYIMIDSGPFAGMVVKHELSAVGF